jgi:hypothetical protein
MGLWNDNIYYFKAKMISDIDGGGGPLFGVFLFSFLLLSFHFRKAVCHPIAL